MTVSAGIVVHRPGPDGTTEILLVHPGGPFWARKDEHAWSIPKGELDEGLDVGEGGAVGEGGGSPEDPEAAAAREFTEELGQPPPEGPRIDLGAFRAGRKTIRAWLVAGDLDVETVHSNTFETEWPPRSGRMQTFPEVDRAAWFDLDTAATKLHKGQIPLIELIRKALADDDG